MVSIAVFQPKRRRRFHLKRIALLLMLIAPVVYSAPTNTPTPASVAYGVVPLSRTPFPGQLGWRSQIPPQDVVGLQASMYSPTPAYTVTDNSVARFDGTSASVVQGSGVSLDDSDNMVFPGGAYLGIDEIRAQAVTNRLVYRDPLGSPYPSVDVGNPGDMLNLYGLNVTITSNHAKVINDNAYFEFHKTADWTDPEWFRCSTPGGTPVITAQIETQGGGLDFVGLMLQDLSGFNALKCDVDDGFIVCDATGTTVTVLDRAGDIWLYSGTVRNLPEPQTPTDAANKQYVDDQLAAIPTHTLVPTETPYGDVVGDQVKANQYSNKAGYGAPFIQWATQTPGWSVRVPNGNAGVNYGPGIETWYEGATFKLYGGSGSFSFNGPVTAPAFVTTPLATHTPLVDIVGQKIYITATPNETPCVMVYSDGDTDVGIQRGEAEWWAMLQYYTGDKNAGTGKQADWQAGTEFQSWNYVVERMVITATVTTTPHWDECIMIDRDTGVVAFPHGIGNASGTGPATFVTGPIFAESVSVRTPLYDTHTPVPTATPNETIPAIQTMEAQAQQTIQAHATEYAALVSTATWIPGTYVNVAGDTMSGALTVSAGVTGTTAGFSDSITTSSLSSGVTGEVATKNQFRTYLSDVSDSTGVLKRITSYWNGSAWVATDGLSAGFSAGYNNTGSNPSLFGAYAGYNNTGSRPSLFGYWAGYNNTGAYSSMFGAYTGQNNTEGSSSMFGHGAGINNTGANPSMFGYATGYNNTGSNPSLFGYQAGFYNSGDNNVAVGYRANNTFKTNAAGAKTFDYTVINASTDTVTITAHGFGTNGTWKNVLFTQGTSPVTGLTTATYYQIYIVSEDVIQFYKNISGSIYHGTNITNAGSGTGHTLTPQYEYTNTTSLGFMAEPSKSNQVVLGNSSVTEVSAPNASIISASVSTGPVTATTGNFSDQVTVPTPSADGSAVNKAYVTSLFTYDCTPTPVIPVAGVTLIYRCGVNTGVNP